MVKNARKTVAAATLALAAGVSVLAASPAMASPGDRRCSSVPGQGDVCITETNNGYDAEFYNNGVAADADFVLTTSDGTYRDQGAFRTDMYDQYNTYFFATGYKGSAYVCVVFDNWTPNVCSPTVYN